MFNHLAKLRAEREEGDKGFTLIELLVVVVIIGILIAIAIPLYLNYRKGANDKSAMSDVRGAVSTLEQCNSDNGSYPVTLGALTAGSYALTGCTSTINVSTNSTMLYKSVTPFASYSLVGTNSSGSSKYYCYNSADGGSVKDISGVTGVADLASALTKC